MNTNVNNFIFKAETKAWTNLYQFSLKHGSLARIAAVPIFFIDYAKISLRNPLNCIEKIILTAKSIVDFVKEKNKDLFPERKEEIKTQFKATLFYAGLSLLAPFVGLILAIVTAASILRAPAESSLTFIEYIKFKKFILDQKISEDPEANAYAKTIWKEHKKNIWENARLENFIKGLDIEKTLTEEIKTRKDLFKVNQKTYNDLLTDLPKQYSPLNDDDARVRGIKEMNFEHKRKCLLEQWKEFKHDFQNCSSKDIVEGRAIFRPKLKDFVSPE